MLDGCKKPGLVGPGLASLRQTRTKKTAGSDARDQWTVAETVIFCDCAPEAVPVMVMENVVADALRLALTFIVVEAPPEVGVTGLGLNETLTPFSWPEAESVTGAGPPLTRVTVMTSFVLLPRLTEMELLCAESEKTGGGAVTVSVTVVVSVEPLEGVPVTVML